MVWSVFYTCALCETLSYAIFWVAHLFYTQPLCLKGQRDGAKYTYQFVLAGTQGVGVRGVFLVQQLKLMFFHYIT